MEWRAQARADMFRKRSREEDVHVHDSTVASLDAPDPELPDPTETVRRMVESAREHASQLRLVRDGLLAEESDTKYFDSGNPGGIIGFAEGAFARIYPVNADEADEFSRLSVYKLINPLTDREFVAKNDALFERCKGAQTFAELVKRAGLTTDPGRRAASAAGRGVAFDTTRHEHFENVVVVAPATLLKCYAHRITNFCVLTARRRAVLGEVADLLEDRARTLESMLAYRASPTLPPFVPDDHPSPIIFIVPERFEGAETFDVVNREVRSRRPLPLGWQKDHAGPYITAIATSAYQKPRLQDWVKDRKLQVRVVSIKALVKTSKNPFLHGTTFNDLKLMDHVSDFTFRGAIDFAETHRFSPGLGENTEGNYEPLDNKGDISLGRVRGVHYDLLKIKTEYTSSYDAFRKKSLGYAGMLLTKCHARKMCSDELNFAIVLFDLLFEAREQQRRRAEEDEATVSLAVQRPRL